MNELDKLIERLITEKGGSRKDYLRLLTVIGNHESGGSFDPTLQQHGGGPGRGLYQFEEGTNKGGIIAAKRLKRYYLSTDSPVPAWLKKAAKSNSLDVSKLTVAQQGSLFLGNMREHPRADLANVVNGKESITDFWADYHWAGKEKDKPKRIQSFKTSTSNLPEVVTFDPNVRNSDTIQKPANAPHSSKEVWKNQWDELSNIVKNPKQFWEDLKKTTILGGNSGKRTDWSNDQLQRWDDKKEYEARVKTQDSIDDNQLYKYIRSTRTGTRKNPDGTESSHLMGQSDNRAYPTLFQNKDGSWDELGHEEAQIRAASQNELYERGSEEDAQNLAEGAWKNEKAEGGSLNGTTYNSNNLNSFNEGGTHEQNPHGGRPMGTGQNGKMNTVEEGEASFNFDDGKYIFTNRF